MVKFYLEKTSNTESIMDELRKLNFRFEVMEDLVACEGNCNAVIKHEVYPTQQLKMVLWNDDDLTVNIYMKEVWSVYSL